MISIGNTIKTLRKAKGVTQEEVARELGVSYQAVSKYENEVAQPDISLIPLLAQYFGVTIDELFGYKLEWHIMGFLFRQWRQVFCITNMEKP